MAIVNVDLSEYDAIRKRNSELEEQVKELKKLNDSLKQGTKVILRKEVVVETASPFEPWGDSQIVGFRESVDRFNKRIVESSESYVNFEDVRLKVENAMQNEVKRSIHDRDCEVKAYYDKRNKLEEVFAKKEKELKEDNRRKFEEEERNLREKYARMTGEFEAERLRILNKLPKIATMATALRDELNKSFFNFKPKLAIKLANYIIDFSTKKE